MKKVLIYFNGFTETVGGGEFLPLMFASELQKTCDVTLAVHKHIDIRTAAGLFGIPIDAGRLNIVEIEPASGFVRRHRPLRRLYYSLRLKKLACGADVCISAENVVDFGKPAHHFVYLLSQFGGLAFHDYVLQVKSRTGVKLRLRKLGTWFCEWVVKPLLGIRPLARILHDPRERVYPTSHYVERTLWEYYGRFDSKTFYPPTIFEFSGSDTPRNPLSVIYVGRLVGYKRIMDIVDIVEKARAISGEDVRLDIAGPLTTEPFVAFLRQVAARKPWIRLVGQVTGEAKKSFMLSGTYAVHAQRDEAFGISVAEYLKAGAIPIVPNEGGSPEVVASPDLTYSTNEEAASILAHLIADAGFRERLHTHCMERAKFFSRDSYLARQRELLRTIIG